MKHLLERGPHAFLLGKYVLTAMGLPFIVVYKNYPMFGTRFRAGYTLIIVIILYIILISYQVILLHARCIHSPIAWLGTALTADSQSSVPVIEVHCNPRRRPVQ